MFHIASVCVMGIEGQDVDSDDGLHDIAKPKKKKAKKEKASKIEYICTL